MLGYIVDMSTIYRISDLSDTKQARLSFMQKVGDVDDVSAIY